MTWTENHAAKYVELARQDIPSLASFAALPAGAGYGTCERKVTVMAGKDDHFALPYDPIPYVNPDPRPP